MEEVKSHSEKFNLDILKIRELKSKSETHADSKIEDEQVEFISNDEALSIYNDDELIVDQNLRELDFKKTTPSIFKNSKKSKREKEFSVHLYLSKEFQEFALQFGRIFWF